MSVYLNENGEKVRVDWLAGSYLLWNWKTRNWDIKEGKMHDTKLMTLKECCVAVFGVDVVEGMLKAKISWPRILDQAIIEVFTKENVGEEVLDSMRHHKRNFDIRKSDSIMVR